MNLIKKLILVLHIFVVLNTTVLASKTDSWSFTQQDFNDLTLQQKDIIKKSYWIGKPYGLENTLAAISIVETRAGEFPDKSRNSICGAHQVNVHIVKENMKTLSSPRDICKALQDNPVLSAIVALDILMYWKENSKTYKTMLFRYNRGWQEMPHDEEFYRRLVMVLRVLENNNIEKL